MAPLLASRVFFSETNPDDISKVQWTYLGIAAFVFLLAVVFFFAPIPEVTDADMELQAEQSAGLTGYEEKPMTKQYKLFFGVAAQFCYVGGQVAVASNFSGSPRNFLLFPVVESVIAPIPEVPDLKNTRQPHFQACFTTVWTFH